MSDAAVLQASHEKVQIIMTTHPLIATLNLDDTSALHRRNDKDSLAVAIREEARAKSTDP